MLAKDSRKSIKSQRTVSTFGQKVAARGQGVLEISLP